MMIKSTAAKDTLRAGSAEQRAEMLNLMEQAKFVVVKLVWLYYKLSPELFICLRKQKPCCV